MKKDPKRNNLLENAYWGGRERELKGGRKRLSIVSVSALFAQYTKSVPKFL
jgi:hypothetical protein